jgi:hypothetical protein
MVRIISNTGAPVVELGVWVSQQNNAEFAVLMDAHSAELTANTVPTPSSAFDVMVSSFLAATNQGLVTE